MLFGEVQLPFLEKKAAKNGFRSNIIIFTGLQLLLRRRVPEFL